MGLWLLAWFLDAICYAVIFISRLFFQESYVPVKRPTHMAFVFTNEAEISVEVLTEIISQCALHKVRQVSFYDPFSRCISHCDQLYRSVKFVWDGDRQLPTVVFDRSRQFNAQTVAGLESEDLRVSLLAGSDGRSCIVDVCKKMVTDRSISCESISSKSISDSLNELHLYEPDLTVMVGTTSTFAGFPPWSLRVTEIYPVATLTPMAPDMFVAFLQAFDRRDRRLGR